jgi:hypothetical protein
MIFLRTDELWAKPQQSIDKITQFLGVDSVKMDFSDYISPSFRKSHAIPEQYQFSIQIAQLTELYTDDILNTQNLTGIKLSDWFEPNYVEPMSPAWK